MYQVYRVHHYSPWWRCVYISIGLLLGGCGSVMFVVELGHILSGKFGVIHLATLPLFALTILLGIGGLIFSFSHKIVVTPHSLQFHSLYYIIRIRWQDLQTTPYQLVICEYSREEPILVAHNPEVEIKPWVKFLPWNPTRHVLKHEIPLWQFGGFCGGQLRKDMSIFAPHLNISTNSKNTGVILVDTELNSRIGVKN